MLDEKKGKNSCEPAVALNSEAIDEHDKLILSKGLIDETLKCLEERRVKSNKEDGVFIKKVGMTVQKTEGELESSFSERFNTAASTISSVIEKLKSMPELTEDFKAEALNVLRCHFVPYCVLDNSEFVFNAIRKCITERIDSSTLKSFLVSLPDAEIPKTAKELKRRLLIEGKSHKFYSR